MASMSNENQVRNAFWGGCSFITNKRIGRAGIKPPAQNDQARFALISREYLTSETMSGRARITQYHSSFPLSPGRVLFRKTREKLPVVLAENVPAYIQPVAGSSSSPRSRTVSPYYCAYRLIESRPSSLSISLT